MSTEDKFRKAAVNLTQRHVDHLRKQGQDPTPAQREEFRSISEKAVERNWRRKNK